MIVWKTRKKPVVTSAERVRTASTICRHAINQIIRGVLALVYPACATALCVSALTILPLPLDPRSTSPRLILSHCPSADCHPTSSLRHKHLPNYVFHTPKK